MKIIHFVYAAEISGLENVSLHILKELKEVHEVYYAAPLGDGINAACDFGIGGIACDTGSVKDMKRVISELNPDVIHCHDPHTSFICALTGARFVIHLHSNCSWLSKFCVNSIALAFACLRAEKIILVSGSIEEEYIFKSLMSGKSVVLPNYVDFDEIAEKSNRFETEQYDLSYVARMNTDKNPMEFIRLVKKIKQYKPDISAVMIGGGELFNDVKTLLEEEGLSDNISLKGYLKNPYPYVKNSRLGVLTSSVEGFGLVAVEAMMLGKPFVASNVGGIPLIVDGSCGFLYGRLDDALDEILKLLSDNDYYLTKSKNAYDKAKLFGNKKAYIDSILEIYKKL